MDISGVILDTAMDDVDTEAFRACAMALLEHIPPEFRESLMSAMGDELSVVRAMVEMAWISGRNWQRARHGAEAELIR